MTEWRVPEEEARSVMMPLAPVRSQMPTFAKVAGARRVDLPKAPE